MKIEFGCRWEECVERAIEILGGGKEILYCRYYSDYQGDMDIDVRAGKDAGILTCAVTYGIGKIEDIVRAKPDYIIDNLLQLKEIIN